MVPRYRPNRWGIDPTRFHGPRVVICKIAYYGDDGKTGGGRGVGINPGGGGTINTGDGLPHL